MLGMCPPIPSPLLSIRGVLRDLHGPLGSEAQRSLPEDGNQSLMTSLFLVSILTGPRVPRAPGGGRRLDVQPSGAFSWGWGLGRM